ncbi:MAG: tetratricopeptide repeat protein [Pseudomonadota bacterium]
MTKARVFLRMSALTATTALSLIATPAVIAPNVATAQTSSWQKRAPNVAPTRRDRQPRARKRTRLKSTVPAAGTSPVGTKLTQPDDNGSARDGRGLLSPPARLQRRLGPLTSLPSGDNAAFIAFEQGLYLTALRLAKVDAARGVAQAQTLIGRLYAEGLGVPRTSAEAAKWYAMAAEGGDPEGAFGLALLYANGNGVEKSPEKAAQFFEQAARTGHAFANYNLALAFLSGQGKPENPQRAAMHLQYAASRNIPRAQYDLSTLFATGHGLAPDAYQAALWLKRAADNGLTVANYEYAVLLLQGRGINADVPLAVDYMRFAATRGIPGAQNRLAHIHFNGKLVSRNPVEGAKWRLIARAQDTRDDALDRIVAELPADVLAKAEAEATSFLQSQSLGAAL